MPLNTADAVLAGKHARAIASINITWYSATVYKPRNLPFGGQRCITFFTSSVPIHPSCFKRIFFQPLPIYMLQGLGRRCLHFNWGDRGAISLDDLNLEVVTDPWDAEFIVAHGTEAVSRPGCAPAAVSLAEINELLAEALEEEGNRPPMIVANPDLVRRNLHAG